MRCKRISNYIENIDFTITKKITKEICEKYKLIPINEEETRINSLTYEDIDDSLKTHLKFLYNKEIEIEIIDKEEFNILKNIIFGCDENSLDELLIHDAISKNASDIHFEPCESHVNIRYRINGSLSLMYKMKLENYFSLISKIKLEANMDITEKRRPQDGKIIKNYNNKKYDFRISSIPVIYGEKVVVRILYCGSFDYRLEELNFSEKQVRLIRKIMTLDNGLFIINGPTGAGKSTTLYTILKELSRKNINITTLEDPVEVFLDNVNQMSLNRNLGIDFSNGLRNILRQNPD